jgi:hypothetical protein
MISFFKFPKGVLQRLNFFQARFFAQEDSEKKKYPSAKLNVVCRLKDQGGLDIQELELQNQALLGKWLFKILCEDGIWQTIIKRKCVGDFSKVY